VIQAKASRCSQQLAALLITISTWFLPAACRRRFHDEWMAELEEMSRRDMALMGPALRIMLLAPSVARALQTHGQRDVSEESLLERLASPAPAVSIRHLVLGTHLRRLRESRGITAEQAADVIRGSHSVISLMERGMAGLDERDVSDLLSLYGVTDRHDRGVLLNLVREVSTPGWWRTDTDILTIFQEPYLGLEATASVIEVYQIQLIPELLQTEDYARAVIRRPVSDEQINRQSELRTSRQDLLHRPDAPQLRVVLDEGVLRRLVSIREVARQQLEFLIEMADLPAVTLQILPFSAISDSSPIHPFTILSFAEPRIPKVVYLEELDSAFYLDTPPEIGPYVKVMQQLSISAEPAARTKKIIRDILTDI
jgi:transcriptional regulator with XRE-family HTH domain